MTRPNDYPESSRQPEFMRIANGNDAEITSEEQIAAGREFKGFIEDRMAAYPDNVYTHPLLLTTSAKTLALYKPDEGGRWSATLKYTPEGASSTLIPLERSITLVFFDDLQNEREQYVYTLDKDGLPWREDYPDALEEEFGEVEAGGIDDIPITDDEKRQHMVDAILSGSLPEPDYQPVGLAEVNGLRSFLTTPDVAPLPPLK